MQKIVAAVEDAEAGVIARDKVDLQIVFVAGNYHRVSRVWKKSQLVVVAVAAAVRRMAEPDGLADGKSVGYLEGRCLVGNHIPMFQAPEGGRRYFEGGDEQDHLLRIGQIVVAVGVAVMGVYRWEFAVSDQESAYCLGKGAELVQSHRTEFGRIGEVVGRLCIYHQRKDFKSL